MSKGSQFERDICRDLSLWWTDNENDAVFWRTSTSGARATVRHRKGKSTRSQHGDICATDPIGQPFVDAFTCEIKRGYTKDTLADLFDRPKQGKYTYQQWFDKIRETARAARTPSWLLIARRDRRVPLVFIPEITASLFGHFSRFSFSVAYRDKDTSVVGARLFEFFEKITADDIRRVVLKER
jgi:hypothetical protein